MSQRDVPLPPHVEKLKQRGNDCFKQSKFDEAFQLFCQAIEIIPTSATLQSNKALSACKIGEYCIALESAELAVAVRPWSCSGSTKPLVVLIELFS